MKSIRMEVLNTLLIDNYIFYDGELISVELFTSMIEDWCCPRAMTAEERADLLGAVFQASGW